MTPYQIAAVCVSGCVALAYAWPWIKEMTPATFLKHVLGIVALALLVVAFAPPRVDVPVDTPSRVSLVLKSATKEDRARVRAFYSAMADVVERDDKIISTVAKWRQANSNALDLAFKGTDLPGKYAGLDAAIDQRLVDAIGKDDVSLSADKRKALVVALKEISDAAR